MRCYHFCNMYLSGIHAGIQSAHAQMELFNKYKPVDLTETAISNGEEPNVEMKHYSDMVKQLYYWTKHEKTMICLNGGIVPNLNNVHNLLDCINKFPYSSFSESLDALNGTLTNVAVVLPNYIYSIVPHIINRTGKFKHKKGSPSCYFKLEDETDFYEYEDINGDIIRAIYSEHEVKLIELISKLKLMT